LFSRCGRAPFERVSYSLLMFAGRAGNGVVHVAAATASPCSRIGSSRLVLRDCRRIGRRKVTGRGRIPVPDDQP
jgi:hypothetical protein